MISVKRGDSGMTNSKTSVYSEKLNGEIEIDVNDYNVQFVYSDDSVNNEEWSNGYWNRDLGDYWNRSW